MLCIVYEILFVGFSLLYLSVLSCSFIMVGVKIRFCVLRRFLVTVSFLPAVENLLSDLKKKATILVLRVMEMSLSCIHFSYPSKKCFEGRNAK